MLVWTVGIKMNLVIQLVNVTRYQIYTMAELPIFFHSNKLIIGEQREHIEKKKSTMKRWIRNMEIVVWKQMIGNSFGE